MDEQSARTKLLALREELSDRVTRINRDLRHRDEPVAADFAEQVTEQENIDVLYALEGEGKVELKQIEAALGRLDAGDYGICDSCGNDISAGRLDVIPFATQCGDCAGAQTG